MAETSHSAAKRRAGAPAAGSDSSSPASRSRREVDPKSSLAGPSAPATPPSKQSTAIPTGKPPLPPGVQKEECLTCMLGIASMPGPCPFSERTIPAGVPLLEQGEVPAEVLLIKKGQLMLSTLTSEGDEWLCSLRGPGTLLGLELLEGEAVSFAAWSVTPVVVCRLDAQGVKAWLGDDRTPAGALLRYTLKESSSRGRERLAASGKTVSRLARFLLERHNAGESGPLKLTNRLLARMLAMRPETLSRALRTLRDEGAVSEEGVTLLDPALLEAWIDETP